MFHAHLRLTLTVGVLLVVTSACGSGAPADPPPDGGQPDSSDATDIAVDQRAPDLGPADLGRDEWDCDLSDQGPPPTCASLEARIVIARPLDPATSPTGPDITLEEGPSSCLRIGYYVTEAERASVEAAIGGRDCFAESCETWGDGFFCGVGGGPVLTSEDLDEICRLRGIAPDDDLVCMVLGD